MHRPLVAIWHFVGLRGHGIASSLDLCDVRVVVRVSFWQEFVLKVLTGYCRCDGAGSDTAKTITRNLLGGRVFCRPFRLVSFLSLPFSSVSFPSLSPAFWNGPSNPAKGLVPLYGGALSSFSAGKKAFWCIQTRSTENVSGCDCKYRPFSVKRNLKIEANVVVCFWLPCSRLLNSYTWLFLGLHILFPGGIC